MTFLSNLPALAKVTADNILPAALVGPVVTYTVGNVLNSSTIVQIKDLPATVTAALFAVAFFGTGTATLAGAAAFVVGHASIKIIGLSLSDYTKNNLLLLGAKNHGNFLKIADRSFRVSAKIANTAAAVFMAYTNPASMLNIVGAIWLGSCVVNNAVHAVKGDWKYI